MATLISWTQITWNLITGCTQYSLGCFNCYAKPLTPRLSAMGQKKYSKGFNNIVCHLDELTRPYTWAKSKLIFINSMSDTFHKEVPTEFIADIFKVVRDCPQHTFQILTKRADRMVNVCAELGVPENAWVGVTIEQEKYLPRLELLKQVDATVRFVSFEPLLGPIPQIDLSGIQWVIVGGESGPNFRQMNLDWARDLRDQCLEQGVPFFFKQVGAKRGKGSKELDGQIWHEFPSRASERPNLEEALYAD